MPLCRVLAFSLTLRYSHVLYSQPQSGGGNVGNKYRKQRDEMSMVLSTNRVSTRPDWSQSRLRLRFHVEVIAHASAGLEFMRLHPQEVFLTIHDDPNPISTIVSGTVYSNPRPPFFPSAQFDFGFELLLPSTLLLYKQFTSCRLRCPLLQ